ncbi:TolC family protein [Novosphingobium sp. KA1]|uniref:TolC family protein n=1 Tax=Novosphingobium sp. (strain KA1) TaxID=164608 RepID=UPI001A8D131B|nr:TolC family protein [Novosphingobium sp. KA1]QSR20150.1 transporter [Novosphingobium sp. KA1]
MFRYLAAFAAVSFCVPAAQAQVQGEPVLTLERAIALAGGSAPAADAARAGVEAARAARTAAGLRPNPSFESQVENVMGSGPYGRFDQAETTAGLSIPIELGGKRSARIAVADAQTSRAQLLSAIAEADIRLQVTQFYVEAVAAERRRATAQDQLRIAREALNGAQIRVKAGRASPLEEQRADVSRVNAEAALERAQRLAETARGNLARRIGQRLTGPLDPAALESLPSRTAGPADTSGAGTLVMAAAEADLAIAEAGVQLSRSQRVPDLTLGPAVRRLEATNATAAVFSLSMPIPLFNSGRAALAQANAERDRAEAQRRMTALDAEQAIAEAATEADNAATTARTASGPALAGAQETARIARIGYREGKFGQLDLLDAERTLAETRLAAIDALAAYQNARARLERLTAPAPEQGH